MRHWAAALATAAMTAGAGPATAEPLDLLAAGSLKAAMTDIAKAFTAKTGIEVRTAFGPSGLLRKRIEGGENASVFASANMAHPQALATAGKGGPVRMFARNTLCALAQDRIPIETATVLDVLLDSKIKVGTSTPKADPSGDYAWKLFERAEKAKPGAYKILDAKARKLTGGPDSPKPPEGKFVYAWVMEQNRADVFLTYCTNAVMAAKKAKGLKVVALPDTLSVGADYGLTVLGKRKEAGDLAAFILGTDGQAILKGYGFAPPAKG